MKKPIRNGVIILIGVTVIGISIIVGSMFFDISKILQVGLAVVLLAEVALFCARITKNKSDK
ncbi:MAG: hypothetical protein IKG93_10055 [Clostridiales bacterium]|jgi:hypothetical protein|nr:hypothetical protein [Clostridiales bacterium]